MSTSVYRSFGLHKGISNNVVNPLTKRFRNAASRRARQGVFLGINFLEDLVKDLREGNFDGVIVKYAIKPKLGSKPQTYELVATQLELRGGDSTDVIRRGINYLSTEVGEPGSTNPPDVGTPPIDAPAE